MAVPATPAEAWKILVVDDEPAVHSVLTRLFAQMGHVTRGVTSGSEALRLLVEPWDLFVIDKNLPEGSGLDLSLRVRNDHPGAVIILVTGYPSKESADALIGVVDEYVTKPFDLPHLREVVTSLMDMRALGRTLNPTLTPPPPVPRPPPSPAPAAPPVSPSKSGRHPTLKLETLHILVADAREEALLLKAARAAGLSASSGPLTDSVQADFFIIDGKSATLEVRKAIWQRQSKQRGLRVAMVVDVSSMTDSSAAVALKAVGSARRPLTDEAALVMLSRLRE